MTALDLWAAAEEKAKRHAAPGRRPKFDEDEHPRDRKGKFVEVGGTVTIRGGGTATVLATATGGRIRVRRDDDGREVVLDAGLTTQTRTAAQNRASTTAPPQAAPARPAADDHVRAAQDRVRELAPDLASPEPNVDGEGDAAERMGAAPVEDAPQSPVATAPQLTAKPFRDGTYRVTDGQGQQVGQFPTIDEANAYIQRAAGRDAHPAPAGLTVAGNADRRQVEAMEGPTAAQAQRMEARRVQLLASGDPNNEVADIEADLRTYGFGKLIGAPEKAKKPAANPEGDLNVSPADLRIGDRLKIGTDRWAEIVDLQVEGNETFVSFRGRRGQIRYPHDRTVRVIRPLTATGSAPENPAPTIDPKLAREQAYARMEHPERVTFSTVDELRDYLRGGAMHASRASAQNVLDEIADDPSLKLVMNSLGGLAVRGKGPKAQIIHTRSGAFLPTLMLDGISGRAKMDKFADALISESINWRTDWGLDARELGKRHPDLAQVLERAAGWVNGKNDPDPTPAPDPAPAPAPTPPAPEPGSIDVDSAPGGFRVGGRVEVNNYTYEQQPDGTTKMTPAWVPGVIEKITRAESNGNGRLRAGAVHYNVVVRRDDGTEGWMPQIVGARGGNPNIRTVDDKPDPAPAPDNGGVTDRMLSQAQVALPRGEYSRLVGGKHSSELGPEERRAIIDAANVVQREQGRREIGSPPMERRPTPREAPRVTVGEPNGQGVRKVRVEYDGKVHETTTRREFTHVAVASYDGVRGSSVWLTLTRAPDSAMRELGKLRESYVNDGDSVTLPMLYELDGVRVDGPGPTPSPDPAPVPTPGGEQPPAVVGGFVRSEFTADPAPDAPTETRRITQVNPGDRIVRSGQAGVPEGVVENVQPGLNSQTMRVTIDGRTYGMFIDRDHEVAPAPLTAETRRYRVDTYDHRGKTGVLGYYATREEADAAAAEQASRKRNAMGGFQPGIALRNGGAKVEEATYGEEQQHARDVAAQEERVRLAAAERARREAGAVAGGDPVGRHSEQGETTPTAVPNLTVGQVIVQLSGNGSPPRYFEVTRAWSRGDQSISWRERVPGAVEETVPAASTRMFSVADNPPAPAPEIDEVPEVIDRLNPPTEDTGPTIAAGRLRAGDRVRQGGEIFTVVAVADGEHADNVAVTLDHAGVRSVEQIGREGVLDWVDDNTLPTPERHARDINARRPPVYTYQRRKLVSLGLDLDDDPLVAAAAQRIRTRQPLSAEEATALAARLRTIADGSDHKTQQRMLGRLADVLDATALGSSSVDASGRFDVNARPIRGTVSDITLGDQAAFVDQAGRTIGGRIAGMRSTMGGRLVEVLVEGPGEPGASMYAPRERQWHLLTKGTVTWRLPDLPEPVHIPEPPKRRKLREHITAGQIGEGDSIVMSYQGQVFYGDVVSAPHTTDNGRTTFFIQARTSERANAMAATVNVVIDSGDGGPSVIRTRRGRDSERQSWDSVLPDERRRKVTADKIDVGDRIEWVPPGGGAGSAKIVTITRVNEALAPDGSVVARTFLFRDDFGDSGSDIAQPDDEMVLAAKIDEDTRAAMEQVRAVWAEQARVRNVSSAIDGAYQGIATGLAGKLFGLDSPSPEDLLSAVNAWERDADVATGGSKGYELYASRIVGRLRGATGYGGPPIEDPDVQAVAQMLGAERSRIAQNFRDSIMEMSPFPDEGEQLAQSRVIRQWTTRPPSQKRNADAMARALIAGHAITSGLRPERRTALSQPPAAEGQLAQRMAAYRASLPDNLADVGNSRVKRASYARLDPAELEKGLLPSIRMSEVSGIDTARDGGPGEAAMSHLAVVQAAGRELAAEYERRVAGLPSQQGVAENRGWVARATEQVERVRSRRQKEIDYAYQMLATEYGFNSWAEVLRARDAGGTTDETRDAWSRAFDALMAQDEKVHDRPMIKALSEQLERERKTLNTAQAMYDDSFRKGAEGRRDAALQLLSEVRPMGGKKLAYIDPDVGRPLMERHELVEGMRYAEKHYPTDWLELIDKAKGGKPWKLGDIPRGNHNWFSQQINLSKDAAEQVPGAGRRGRVATHELGHGMEQAVPGLLAMERAYLWSRTSTGEIGDRERETKKHLGGGYAAHENAYHDEWPTGYTGKDYGEPGGGAEAYEVFTTGVESMFGGSNYLDEDFRAWMFGVMALLGETDNRAAQFAEERRTARRAKAVAVAKDAAGVPWRLDYDYLSSLDEEKLDELADHLAQGLGEGDPREGQRWEDYEAYMAAQQGVDELVASYEGSSDEEITAAVDQFLAVNGRPGLTHPRVGGSPNKGRGVTRAEVQDEYATFLEVQYLDAEETTNGHMLNDAGRSRGVHPRDLFTGRIEDVYRYASEELLAYWETNRRVGWSEYYYERTKSPGSARAAQRQAEANARINRDRSNRPVSSTRRRSR